MGMFEDGEKGSPVIACELMETALKRSKGVNPALDAVFIEKKYADALKKNISKYPFAQVVPGNYEKEVEQLKQLGQGRSLFLYVDPYGVKHLDCNVFCVLSSLYESAEVLLNFNSFGFFRAACAQLGVEYNDVEEFDEILEIDPWTYSPGSDASSQLTRAIGGDYWRDIVLDYMRGEIDGYEAELRLTVEFCNHLRGSYKYVLNIPVKMGESHHPKYRMIHMSNHHDGCLLMYESMRKRLDDLFDIQHDGQTSLFKQDKENNYVNVEEELRKFDMHVEGYEEYIQLEIVLAEFVTCLELGLTLKELRDHVKELEKAGKIDVKRTPEFSERTGKRLTFIESNHSKKIYVRKHK